jgi:TolB protein
MFGSQSKQMMRSPVRKGGHLAKSAESDRLGFIRKGATMRSSLFVALVLIIGFVAPMPADFWLSANQRNSTIPASDADELTHNAGKLLFRSRLITASPPRGQIWTMNADGSDARQITCNDRDDVAATWSPNGQWILFYSGETLPNGLPIQNLYFIGANDECGPGTFLTEGRFADWSPVGQKIAFDRGRLGVRDIYVRYMDGTEVNVTNNATARNTRASWSPDGKKIAFAGGPGGEGTEDVYVINEDGSELTQLTFGAQGNNGPRFSPNGRKIAFQSDRDGGRAHRNIYVMNADGTDQTRLTDDIGAGGFPNWSPNGQKIVFMSSRTPDGSMQLFIMNADGTDQTQITDPPTTNSFSAWGAGHDVPQKSK